MCSIEVGSPVLELKVWDKRENNRILWGFHYEVISFTDTTVVAYRKGWGEAWKDNNGETKIAMADWLQYTLPPIELSKKSGRLTKSVSMSARSML